MIFIEFYSRRPSCRLFLGVQSECMNGGHGWLEKWKWDLFLTKLRKVLVLSCTTHSRVKCQVWGPGIAVVQETTLHFDFAMSTLLVGGVGYLSYFHFGINFLWNAPFIFLLLKSYIAETYFCHHFLFPKYLYTVIRDHIVSP